ncbi:CehA/McbA family metallohydrolase [Clostridium sp. K12(2020)]|nr:CehA/McbA family metallohydrolase [Clostridium sp. K12(2020)]MBX9144340.1 CehA/McbA family metallohydrolase [Clostridium sp. K13]
MIFDQNKLKYYYGIPHCHSSYSTGKGTPLDLYEFAIKCGLDFLFVTDHNDFLANKTIVKERSFTKWEATNYFSNKIRKNEEDFLPIVGFECRTISFGDFNVINPSNFFTGTVKDLRLLTLWMLNNSQAFIIINHPHKEIGKIQYNEVFNKIITSIEVYNGNPASKYTKHEKYYYQLLDKGWKLGAVNGQDNHRINFDQSDNLTAYIANDLSRNSLIDAFRSHRTYSTESRFLKLHFSIDETFMGDTLSIYSSKVKFSIFTEDIRYKIKEIQIISNGGTIIKKIEDINLNSIKYIYEHQSLNSETWYVIRVLQDENKTAVSSPIFIVHLKNNYT